MKLLVLLLVLLFGVWLWRRGRRQADAQTDQAQRRALPMVRCAHCQLHLPGQDAVVGHQGQYCSAAHRREAEGT